MDVGAQGGDGRLAAAMEALGRPILEGEGVNEVFRDRPDFAG